VIEYRSGIVGDMSAGAEKRSPEAAIQITVRIPPDLLAFADQLVESGEARSRADVMAQGIRCIRRRQQQDQEIAVLRASTLDPDAEEGDWAIWATRNAAQIWADLD
jgi:Arc/MetJ-type ribon-helix-helix transcriptional regulator